MATNKSELLLSGKLLNRILPFHRFLLRVILLKIHQLHRAAVLRILGTFPTVMCFQPFLKIIRPAGVQRFITAFYNVCIVSLMLVLFVSFFHYLLPIIAFLFFSFLLFYCFILLPFLRFSSTVYQFKLFIISCHYFLSQALYYLILYPKISYYLLLLPLVIMNFVI